MAQLSTPTQIHEKLKSNQSGSNIHIWFPSSDKQEYIFRRNESLEQTKVVRNVQPLKANNPGNKADPWMLLQASLVAIS